jgi:hypothetical protein
MSTNLKIQFFLVRNKIYIRFLFPNHRAQNGHINQQHLQSFTLIFNHYLETTQRKQREIIIRRKESVSHKEDICNRYLVLE